MSRAIDVRIPTADDRQLGARCWQPDGDPIGQVVIHGATAVPHPYYRAFASHLADRGFRVLTYDYRGVGASREGSIADDPVTMRDWIDDADAAQRWLSERAPDLPLLAIGHSFGGQIAAALPHAPRADALVLVAAQSGYWRRFPAAAQARLWLSWTVILPGLTRAFGYLPSWAGLGEDLPAGVARQWARWCLSPDYFLSELPELQPRLGAYDGRVLALSFHDDDFAPVDNVRWLLGQLRSAPIEHRHLAPLDAGMARVGHFGAFRPAAEAGVWSRVEAFLADVARPPGWRHAAAATGDTMRAVLADLAYGRA